MDNSETVFLGRIANKSYFLIFREYILAEFV